jgi:phosphate transport system substrate-binding protein
MKGRDFSMRTAKAIVLGIVIVLALVLSACTPKPEPVVEPPVAGPMFTLETYPRVDGSTATIPLSEGFASALMEMSLEEVRPYILHNKTHQAYVNLIERKADIIFVTSPSEDELKLAKDRGVALEVVPVVSEGFVFLVSSDNPVKGLTVEQIRRIYAGQHANWAEVGGPDLPITAYQRPVNSGSQTGLLDLVMKDLEPMKPPTERVIAGMGELIDAVSSYSNEPDAIGYSYYYFVTDMWGNEKVRLLEVNNVYPDKASISSGRYPFRTAYYAVIRADEPETSPVRKMLAWILSDEGQAVAEDAGYVKVR